MLLQIPGPSRLMQSDPRILPVSLLRVTYQYFPSSIQDAQNAIPNAMPIKRHDNSKNKMLLSDFVVPLPCAPKCPKMPQKSKYSCSCSKCVVCKSRRFQSVHPPSFNVHKPFAHSIATTCAWVQVALQHGISSFLQLVNWHFLNAATTNLHRYNPRAEVWLR